MKGRAVKEEVMKKGVQKEEGTGERGAGDRLSHSDIRVDIPSQPLEHHVNSLVRYPHPPSQVQVSARNGRFTPCE